MNMKSFKNSFNDIENSFNDIFKFDNEQDQLEVDAKVLASKFLSKVQEEADNKNINRKELAKLIGTSPSYLTQLFRGHKLLNLLTVVKLQKVLEMEFDISLKNETKYSNSLNKENIAQYLNNWYEENKAKGDYIKIMRNFSNNKSKDIEFPMTLTSQPC